MTASKPVNQQSILLNNNLLMPQIGLGVFKAQEGGEVEQAILTALEQGYRKIDTASVYRNEAGVGKAIRQSGISREDIFLATKVWNTDQGYQETLAAFEQSLDRLQTHYVDLYLVHWPVKGKYKETYKALEKIYGDGKAKAIGVSNFQIHHLEDLMAAMDIVPAVNQVEMHPHLQQKELLTFAQKHHILLEAWRPIMMGEVLNIPELQSIAALHGKSAVQITLRWLIQKGVAIIPKSANPKRIAQNIDIFDFELSDSEMQTVAQLDLGKRLGPDPDNFNF